jgi:tight adherence protein C
MILDIALVSSVLIGSAIAGVGIARAAPQIDQKAVLTSTGVKTLTEEDKSLLQLKITRAGLSIAPEYFQGIRVGMTALIAVVIIFLALLTSTITMYLLLPLAAIGYLVPSAILNGKIDKRKLEFRNRLDDFVLYLSTALRSSPELIVALQEAGRSTGGVYEEEVSRVVQENSLGRNLTDALLDMAYRVDDEEVASLLTLISQSSIHGGSVSDKMQDYADKLREGKRYDIMDQAAKINTKLIFVVLVFMLIPTLMAIGFPAFWALNNNF